MNPRNILLFALPLVCVPGAGAFTRVAGVAPVSGVAAPVAPVGPAPALAIPGPDAGLRLDAALPSQTESGIVFSVPEISIELPPGGGFRSVRSGLSDEDDGQAGVFARLPRRPRPTPSRSAALEIPKEQDALPARRLRLARRLGRMFDNSGTQDEEALLVGAR